MLSNAILKAERSPLFGVLCSIILAAILAYPLYCDGFDSFVVFGDEGDSNLPQLMYLKEMIMKQGISFWWYNSVSGTDYFGSAVVIKSNVLMFLLLPNYLAYLLCRYFAYAIGIYSTYILMRGYFNTNGIVSILTGFLFMSRLMYEPLLGHGWSMSLLPLALYYFCKIDKVSIVTLSISALYGFLFGLTGNFTQTFYMLYFVFLFCVILRAKEIRFWLLNFVACSFLHIISQVPDILTAFSVAGISHRSEDLYVLIRESVLSSAAVNTARANLMTYVVNRQFIIMHSAEVLGRHLFLIAPLVAIVFTKGNFRRTLVKLLLFYFVILYADAFTMNVVQTAIEFFSSVDGTQSKIIACGIDTRLWMMKPLIESVMMLVSMSYMMNYLGSLPSLQKPEMVRKNVE